jgi:hypothetical protein
VSAGAPSAPVNPPPAEAALSVYVFREAVAVIFVVFWLVLFAGELLTGRYVLPFWFHCVAVGVLAYALGVSVASLTSFRDPGGGRGGHVRRSGAPGQEPTPEPGAG